ncbi:MAG: hypothetical protein ACXVI0_06175 [Halobacteriota archaeon]
MDDSRYSRCFSVVALFAWSATRERRRPLEITYRQIVFVLTIVSVLVTIVMIGVQGEQQAAQRGTRLGALRSWVITFTLLRFLGLYIGFMKNARWFSHRGRP